MKLLIVDDEPSILELLTVALEAIGSYNVTSVTSGEKALELIGNDDIRFDCVLLDIQMPGMDGIEVCTALRANPRYRSAPIVMLTAMSQMSYVDKAFRAGATDYLTKPFDFEELRLRMAEARQTSAQRQLDSPEEEGGVQPPNPFSYGQAVPQKELDFSRIDRMLGAAEFDNYVKQMSQSKAEHTRAFAVKVSNGAKAFTKLSPEGYNEAVTAVANTIAEGTQKAGSLICYRGRGLFLCVEYGKRLSNTEQIETCIQDALSACRLGKYTPAVSVSKHTKLALNNKSAAMALLRDAVSSVEARDAGRRPPASLPNWVLRAHIQSEESEVFERKAYDEILRRMLRSG